MFIVDDILLRTVGVSVPPFDLIWLFERIGEHAHMQLHDPIKIMDAMKENRMLYEIGEKSKTEYKKNHDELKEKLLLANLIRERAKANSGNVELGVL